MIQYLEALNFVLYWISTLRYLPLIISEIYNAFFRTEKNLRKMYKKWAIVTGCTDGIGKAYCFELAKKGFNLVLLSRTQEKLENVQKELKSFSPSTETKILQIDFTDLEGKKSELTALLDEIKDQIGILINNVGVSGKMPQYFHLEDGETIHNILKVNILATVEMTKLVLKFMLKSTNSQGVSRKGTIINISSGFSIAPCGLYSTYGGSKAFIDQFTSGMDMEYKEKGIDFQSQRPNIVATKMSGVRNPSTFAASPAQYAEAAVKCIGLGFLEVPFWSHRLQNAILSLLPEFITKKYLLKVFKSRRAKIIKKNHAKSID